MFKKRRRKKISISIPGMWFHSMTRDEQLDYRNKNRPRGCEDCTEFPCLTHDGMRTWNCGKCDEKKKPGGEGVEELQVQA